ncbi:hypothetical protein NDU88_001716 [Pleurodeles waltl]|uniref:Uncharacterized protein n=1 Tax=Pleurodeles waltl TaxID=8319 RepID=A0AAV7VAJ9_PLEWA|nr:hypothetical protein NDU88_001716 [Pleurodeles waltl]
MVIRRTCIQGTEEASEETIRKGLQSTSYEEQKHQLPEIEHSIGRVGSEDSAQTGKLSLETYNNVNKRQACRTGRRRKCRVRTLREYSDTICEAKSPTFISTSALHRSPPVPPEEPQPQQSVRTKHTPGTRALSNVFVELETKYRTNKLDKGK